MFDLFAVGVIGWFLYACLAFAVLGLRQAVENREWRNLDDHLIVTAMAPVVAVGLAVFYGAKGLMWLAERLRRIAVPFGCLVLALALVAPGQALAADTTIVIPWGDWVADILAAALVPLAGIAIVALRKLPAGIVEWAERITGERVEQLLERAIGWGINAVSGAVRGQTLGVEVGMAVAREALEYAVRHAPALVKRIGFDLLREKIFARLDLDQRAAIQPSIDSAANAALMEEFASGLGVSQKPGASA